MKDLNDTFPIVLAIHTRLNVLGAAMIKHIENGTASTSLQREWDHLGELLKTYS